MHALNFRYFITFDIIAHKLNNVHCLVQQLNQFTLLYLKGTRTELTHLYNLLLCIPLYYVAIVIHEFICQNTFCSFKHAYHTDDLATRRRTLL